MADSWAVEDSEPPGHQHGLYSAQSFSFCPLRLRTWRCSAADGIWQQRILCWHGHAWPVTCLCCRKRACHQEQLAQGVGASHGLCELLGMRLCSLHSSAIACWEACWEMLQLAADQPSATGEVPFLQLGQMSQGQTADPHWSHLACVLHLSMADVPCCHLISCGQLLMPCLATLSLRNGVQLHLLLRIPLFRLAGVHCRMPALRRSIRFGSQERTESSKLEARSRLR